MAGLNPHRTLTEYVNECVCVCVCRCVLCIISGARRAEVRVCALHVCVRSP